MNIFYLDKDPKICAEMHLDKHSSKMMVEYAQLMSTAHRVLDGKEVTRLNKIGRTMKTYSHPRRDHFSTNLVMSITLVTYGFDKVKRTTNGCMICGVVYTKSFRFDMAKTICHLSN